MRVCGKRVETAEIVTVVIESGRIEEIKAGQTRSDLGGPDVWIAPGFFDIQINGYAGRDFNRAVWAQSGEVGQALYDVRDRLARAGTALFLPTITTNAPEAISTSLRTLTQTLEADADVAGAVPGFHLEGPFMAPEDGPRGAHPLEYVRDPDWDLFQTWQDAAQGRIRICTLAPERPGALEFIEKLAASGVVAAIGHTAATPEVIRDAVSAGAALSTHLGNGAHSILPRHPNYIWEQLADDHLYASLITDGHHLPASVAKCMARVKGPERTILVSDAVSLGGLTPGIYGERFEVLPSGRVNLAGTPYLAGAGHLLDTCVANALRFTDFSLAETVDCVTVNPARLLGLDGHKGRLAPGFDADLTLFRIPEEGPLEIVATLCAGTNRFIS